MTWQTVVVSQVTGNAASHLNWLHFQDLAAGSIDAHGDNLQVRGDLLRRVISSFGLGGDARLEGRSRLLAAIVFATFLTKVTYSEKVSGGSRTLRISLQSSGLSFSKKV